MSHLGVVNVLRVVWYRTRIRLGLHPVQRIRATLPTGYFFSEANDSEKTPTDSSAFLRYFGWYEPAGLGTSPPDWFLNPFTGKRFLKDAPWWELPDFVSEIGDIKAVWEPSRFGWLVPMAEQSATGLMNVWLRDWCQKNPAYRGPNWKCGQECSIRVMHLAKAALVLGEHRVPSSDLLALIRVHLQRIYPTTSYAKGQDNNHGTSEGAALFIGGSWMNDAKYMDAGRKLLEDRVDKLIAEDGTFSQYSVTYHRLMLDTLSLVEEWRTEHVLDRFSDKYYERASAATGWLTAMVDAESGDAPNIGANDGAHICIEHGAEYRNFTQSVSRAQERFGFTGENALDGSHGFLVKKAGFWMLAMRTVSYRFRPSQADALHTDLWYRGRNILRDAGTYSYAGTDDERRPFQSVSGHNAVQFDGRDQMPLLGRFLYGQWLKPLNGPQGYRDYRGATHKRDVELSPAGLTVTDHVAGFQREAVLRWRLEPGDWKLDSTTAICGDLKVEVTADVPITRVSVTQGLESRFYMKSEKIPVLEVTVSEPSTIVTRITANR